MSYLTVFALTIGTLIAFGLVTALTTETRTFTYAGDDGNEQTYTEQQTRTDRTWPLLAPNPFVVLADAAPRLPERRDPVTGELLGRPLDPLGSLGDSVREARRGPDNRTATEGPGVPTPSPSPDRSGRGGSASMWRSGWAQPS